MSLENKVNATTEKLVAKFKTLPEHKVMENVLTSKEFKAGLTKLMDEHSKGLKFEPKFNDIFKPFYECDWKNIKVVIVYPYKGGEEFIDKLTADGVLILRTPLTWGNKKVTHMNMWKDTVKLIIDQIGYHTVKTVFAFVEKETESFKKSVRKHHYKFFFPIEKNFPIDKFQESVNDLLKKIGKEPINW